MATTILIPEKDPMGAAISDFFNLHRADRLRVFSSQFEEDEIPVKELFRSMPSMPMLERTALQMATGQILDVGAGSGCHALALQDMGKEVCAIDISPLSVEVMQQRGVRMYINGFQRLTISVRRRRRQHSYRLSRRLLRRN